MGDEATAPKGVEQRTAHLLNFAAQYRHYALATYVEARPLYERALAISEKVLGAEHPTTAASLNELADLLVIQGDLARARPLYERALAISERCLAPSIQTPRRSSTTSQRSAAGAEHRVA